MMRKRKKINLKEETVKKNTILRVENTFKVYIVKYFCLVKLYLMNRISINFFNEY